MTKAKVNRVEGMMEDTKLADAKRQGQAQFDSIKEMVEDLQRATEQDQEGGADEIEAPRQRIEEDALSVQVWSGWYQPGSSEADRAPAEYEILLCTGGPACRIMVTSEQFHEIEMLLNEARTLENECRCRPMKLATKVEMLRKAKAIREQAMAIGRPA